MALTFELLKIKMLASSCTSKLQVIDQIKGGWDTEDDDEFAISRMEIELETEYAVQVFQEIVTIVEQLLSDPPAYNDNPDEQHQRQMELQVLGGSAHDYVVALKDKVASLRDSVNDAMGTRVQEAFVRAKKVQNEAHDIVDIAKKLQKHEVTQ